MDSTCKKYIVEPRFEDGSLNAKDPNGCFMTFSANGVAQTQLFGYYFKHHKDAQSANWGELVDFFKTKGWYIREKTW